MSQSGVCPKCNLWRGNAAIGPDPCPRCGHVHEHDWKPVGLDSWRCECGATRTAIV